MVRTTLTKLWTVWVAAAVVLLCVGCANASSDEDVRADIDTSTAASITAPPAPIAVDPTPPVPTALPAPTIAATPTAAPSAPTPAPSATPVPVRTGAGVLVDSDFDALDGQRVGLIAHQNSVVDGVHLGDMLAAAPNVELVAMFGPEHGVRGTADAGEYIADASDPTTGVPVFSLYGPTRQPTAQMLAGVDVLVYDLQDVGTRYYTYISTMGLAMQAAAQAGIDFMVLERPNPLGDLVGGGVLEAERISFVGQYPIPDVYGLTSAQLAQQIMANNWLTGLESLDLSVVELEGWDPSMRWVDTGLPWIPPSPAIISPDTALLYPATIYFEATNISYGRGTETPFEVLGAPWLDADALAADLQARNLPGINIVTTEITPAMLPGMTVEPAYLGQTLPAIQLVVVDHQAIVPTELGVHLLDAVFAQARTVDVDLLPRPTWLDQLSGSDLLRRGIAQNTLTVEEILAEQARQRGQG